MQDPETKPGKSRTIKVRPNPPIIPPPERPEASPVQVTPEVPDPSALATDRGVDLAAGIAAIRKAEDVAMRPSDALIRNIS